MVGTISCQQLAELQQSDGLIAVFDVRERGEYNQGQIPHSTSLPRSQMEFRIAELVPARNIQIILYDDDGARAERAAGTLSGLGYANVAVLAGGLAAWQQGFETVNGVNVPSKAFGEKVHHERQVPDISPEELKALQDRGEDLVIFDVRTPEEYGRFCIPGGQSVPGGELILWAEELRQKPTVIVNCAGRTRSIIAAAALRRLGLSNVRALRNGTMGWLLAGFTLESSPERPGPSAPAASRVAAAAAARRIAVEENISFASSAALRETIARTDDVAYLIDVRSLEEYASGHVPGSIHVPGGQAVQRADDFVAVRNGQIVFISNESARAVMAAYWYRQMGIPRVAVLEGGLNAWIALGWPIQRGAPVSNPLGLNQAKVSARLIDCQALHQQIENKSLLILDVGTSLEFEMAHIPGAKWISRGWLDLKLPTLYDDRAQAIVLTCSDGAQSIFAACALAEEGYANVSVLAGGVSAWSAAGFTTKSGLGDTLCEPNDVVLSPSIRGSREDMQNYLNWELKLKH